MHCTDTTRQTYKASRLGMEVYEDVKLVDVQVFTHPVFGNIVKAFPVTVNEEFAEVREVKMKRYELNSHQSSVHITVSDRKLSVQQGTTTQTAFYTADVISYGDYYPFGMQKPGRFGAEPDAKYRYKHQGQESDSEILGEGNSYAYEYRMSDARLGRFWSIDPLSAKYAYNSPYAFSENDVIRAVELEGLERRVIINYVHITKDDKGATVKVDRSTVTHNVLAASLLQHGIVAATLEYYGVKLKGPDYYGTQTVNVATYSDGTYSASSTYEDSKSEFIYWTKSLGSNNKREYKGIPSDGDVFDEGDHDYNLGSGGKMDPDENPEGYGGFGSGNPGSGNNWFAPPPSQQWQQNPIVPQLEDQTPKQSGDGYYYYREKSTGDTVIKSTRDLNKQVIDTTRNKYNLKTDKRIEAEYEFYKGDKKK